jgi:small-conductance mechanosensitive channel
MWNELTRNTVIESGILFFLRLVTGLVVWLVFWGVALAAQRLVDRLGRVRGVDTELVSLLGRIAKIGLLTFGAITACGTLGIDVTALVAGLGLTGFALGFALKDIISNALSGMLILIYKPFRRGDRIAVTGFEGTVQEINLRYTILDDNQKKIFIPNANLFTNPVTVLLQPRDALPPAAAVPNVIEG